MRFDISETCLATTLRILQLNMRLELLAMKQTVHERKNITVKHYSVHSSGSLRCFSFTKQSCWVNELRILSATIRAHDHHSTVVIKYAYKKYSRLRVYLRHGSERIHSTKGLFIFHINPLV